MISPYFLSFVRETIEKYEEDRRIAGIGLYNYSINRSTPYRFEAVNDGYDVYFMQSACSWGQIWSKNQWRLFYEWYMDNNEPFNKAKGVPDCICRWDERSWLKYYIRYCVEKDLYFVYPRISLVTDYSDTGTHAKESSNAFQIPVLMGEKKWNLPSFEKAKYKYDVFYENETLYDCLGVSKDDLLVDLYGVREKDVSEYSYWLTSIPANYKVVRSFGLLMRPRDLNVLLNVSGEDIYLYDLDEKTNSFPKSFRYKEIKYHIGDVNTKELFKYSIKNAFERFAYKIRFFAR